MLNTIINENWNYTYYKNEDLKAMISLAHDYSDQNELQEHYFATVMDGENNDLMQHKFSNIDAACQFLNRKYNGVWELISLEKVSSGTGCSTCVAH